MFGTRGFWDRHERKLKRLGTVLAVITGFITLATFASSRLAGSDSGPVTLLTPEEQRLIGEVPPAVGWRCRPDRSGAKDSESAQRMDELTSAYAVCAPSIKGPRSLRFRAFTTVADMNEFMDELYRVLGEPSGGCSGGSQGETPWVDASGSVRGTLVCSSSESSSSLSWSDRKRLLAGIAQAPPGRHAKLYIWWQEAVRFNRRDPSAYAQRHLRSLLPPGYGPCETYVRMPAAAIAGLSCRPGDGIWSAAVAQMATKDLLGSYIEARAAAFSDLSDKGCRESTRSFTVYGESPDAEPVHGRLLCHAEDGVQWFEWTASAPRLYAFLARRDESLPKLFHQWSTSFSDFDGLD